MTKGKSGKAIKGVNPSVAAISYNGPTSLPKTNVGNETQVVEIKYVGSISTSAGGVINTVLDSYAQCTSSPDWASLGNLWQEARVLSMHTHLEPYNKYNQPTTNALAPVYVVVARDSNTALASLSEVAGYNSSEIHAPSTAISKVIKMADSGEAQFTPTGSGPAAEDRLYIKFYSSGNANSIAVYDYMTTLLVQFRGRK